MDSNQAPQEILNIAGISNEFHKAGVLGKDVIIEIFRRTRNFEVLNSVETGCGKSTLLLSNISNSHLCFTLGGGPYQDDGSLAAVTGSPYFKKDAVEFVLGPTQKTVPSFSFKNKFQLIFIDGPHGYPFPNLEYYYLYPYLDEGGLLIVDDIHIPTIEQLADFLKEDEMFDFLGNVNTTAFFRRTSAPLFDPCGDGWWLQKYNIERFEKLSQKYQPISLKSKAYIYLSKNFGAESANRIRGIYRSIFH